MVDKYMLKMRECEQNVERGKAEKGVFESSGYPDFESYVEFFSG